jgi:hypothetical protein
MAPWAELARQAPDLAAAGESLFRAFTIGYLATLRADGSPRIHPVTITLHDGGLFAFPIAGSAKAADLARDPRYALHSFPRAWSDEGWDDEELTISGRALLVKDVARRAAVVAAHNDSVGADDPLYELLIERVFHKSRDGGRVQHATWRDGT